MVADGKPIDPRAERVLSQYVGVVGGNGQPAELDPQAESVLSQYVGVVDGNGQPVELGRGTFATVYKATKKDDDVAGRMYAVKVMSRAWSDIEDKEKKLVISEINTLFKCKHQHIIGWLPVF